MTKECNQQKSIPQHLQNLVSVFFLLLTNANLEESYNKTQSQTTIDKHKVDKLDRL